MRATARARGTADGRAGRAAAETGGTWERLVVWESLIIYDAARPALWLAAGSYRLAYLGGLRQEQASSTQCQEISLHVEPSGAVTYIKETSPPLYLLSVVTHAWACGYLLFALAFLMFFLSCRDPGDKGGKNK